ncbi:hypothetical protein MRX96_016105 [Rhipicephalus microplus]
MSSRKRVSNNRKLAVPSYKLPRVDLREKLLPEKVSALKTKISSSLPGAEYVCIALDVWPSRSVKGFLPVEATFADRNFADHPYLLSFARLTGSHATGARIRCEYDAMLLQCKIADKVIRMVTDNASSMIIAFEFARWETEKDSEDGSFDECPERFTKWLLSEFHQLEKLRFGGAAHTCGLP